MNSDKQEISEPELFTMSILSRIGFDIEQDNNKIEPVCRAVLGEKFFFFRGGNLPINNAAAADLARDKYATNYYLKKAQINVPNSIILNNNKNNNLRRLESFSKRSNCNLYIKPNFGYEGIGVYKLTSKTIINPNTIEQILNEKNLILQEEIIGKDYRVVMLKEKIIFLYERKHLKITGDGKSTINQLINKKIKNSNQVISSDDTRITNCLANQGYSKDNILKKNKQVLVFDTTNLSTGGTIHNLSISRVSKEIVADLGRISKIMDLTFFAVDIICPDITNDISYKVLEINSAPEFFHYYNTSANNKRRIIEMYKEIVKILVK
jgi:cyanophycin synthetase